MHHSYQLAERFIEIQGEGTYIGALMGFLRFTGCSVGKRICQHCDTDFDNMDPWKGGGLLSLSAIQQWVEYESLSHVCFTGGEPLDQPNLAPLVEMLIEQGVMIHIETSGTVKYPDWITHDQIYVTMSPKPGWLRENITPTHQFKVIVGGLGNTPGWPTLQDALDLAAVHKKIVFLQPRNNKFDVNFENLRIVRDVIRQAPNLRLSVQLHKLLKVR